MELSKQEQRIITTLDDGSLYADPDVVRELFHYPDMQQPQLLVRFGRRGQPKGYLPVGHYYNSGELSYIAAMPNSPPISSTYPPGAGHILSTMCLPYFDTDVVSSLPFCQQVRTASVYGLSGEPYFDCLSAARRKDFRRKLKKANNLKIRRGTLSDVREAWRWMHSIWETRGEQFGHTAYADYLDYTMSWLQVLDRSSRTILKIDRYLSGTTMIAVNCCVLHRYQGRMHCDDYLTWYQPEAGSGLGIVSVIKNLTHPALRGFRYNLGTPGINGVHPGHEYKMTLLPADLLLTQAVLKIDAEAAAI